MVPSEEGSSGSLAESLVSILRGVLLIERVVVDDFLFDLPDDGEDEWLSIFISVGSDTKVDLVGVLVGLESLGKSEDGVGGGEGDVLEFNGGEVVVKGSESLHGKKILKNKLDIINYN